MARHTFRRSVVSIAAAFVALPGCGDQVAESERCQDAKQTPGCMPVVDATACPAMAPKAGSPCQGDEPTCNFGSCDESGVTQAACRDGTWLLQAQSCGNPPFFGEACPDKPPQDGEPCDVREGETCGYSDGECPDGITNHEATCEAGSWVVARTFCNPPPELECPADLPIAGAACDGPLDAECAYPGCGGPTSVIARCTETGWQVDAPTCNPPPPECPVALPAAETECAEPGQTCFFDDESESSAECVDGKWQVTCGLCNPPPPDVCPADAPAQDAPCAVANEICLYGDCSEESNVVATCTAGAWVLEPETCNPPPPETDEQQ